jgi:hypothetical protein
MALFSAFSELMSPCLGHGAGKASRLALFRVASPLGSIRDGLFAVS